MMILNFPATNSIPVPHGVDGIIYELDGITQVRKGIDFYVQNINNGQIISGKTGYGSSGRYSVSLKGNDGDIIAVKAWNKYNQVNITLPLIGVMRNVNLLLNMTYPPIAPNITSIPVTNSVEDMPYTYDAEAFDENEEDILEYFLIIAPTGMTINSSTGLVKWTPLQEHVGSNNATIQVSDNLHSVNQSFIINAENINDKPEIISIPAEHATEDANYFYDVNALDEDNDPLSYYLISSPSGMIINKSTGLINWTPSNDNVGTYEIVILASDDSLADEQRFAISVANVNDLPVISSVPVAIAAEDEIYTYDVDANDIDNDVLKYSLIQHPTGMGINKTDGKILWLPSNDDVGVHNVTVKVSDDGGFVIQQYALFIENVNDGPIINSTPPTEARLGRLYTYDVDAYDADNDTLAYSLITRPGRMKIERILGLIEWRPVFAEIGKNKVIVRASDGNLTDQQEFDIYVYFPNERENPSDEGENEDDSGSNTGGGSGGGGGGGKSPPKNEKRDNKKPVVRMESPGSNKEVKVEKLNERPKDAAIISRRVYTYLKVENLGEVPIEDATINFTVDLRWLDENQLNYEDIVLSRHTQEGWQDLATIAADKDDEFVYYTAETPGFSYFAITVKEGVTVKNYLNPQISAIKVPFKISGTIYKFGKFYQADPGTKLVIENLNTSESQEAETGIGPYTGAYYALVYGNKEDLIRIKAGSKELFLTLDDTENLDLMLGFKDGFCGITGYSIVEKFSIENGGSMIMALLAAISLAFLIKIKYKK